MQGLGKLDCWVCSICRRSLGFFENRLAPLTLLLLLAALILPIRFWDCWSKDESGGTAVRNLVLVIATIVALPLAIWRSKVAERQAETAQRQAETAQRELLNERYQRGREMLDNEKLWVRLNGIDTLARLAREYPEDYHTQIMSSLCTFVRTPSVEVEEQNTNLREDFQAIVKEFRGRNAVQIEIENREQYQLDLSGAQLSIADLRGVNLRGVNLRGANLRRANLAWANLSGGTLTDTDLSGAQLTGAQLTGGTLSMANLSRATLTRANLTRAILLYADLTDVVLENANLSSVILKGCKGLTQEQIDQAVADEDNPPNIEGVVDANTGRPLVWRGNPIT